jgi:hypothetical protein
MRAGNVWQEVWRNTMCGVKSLQCCGSGRDKKNNILGKTTIMQQLFSRIVLVSFSR